MRRCASLLVAVCAAIFLAFGVTDFRVQPERCSGAREGGNLRRHHRVAHSGVAKSKPRSNSPGSGRPQGER